MPDTGACNVFHQFVIEGFFVDVDLPSTMELDCSNGNLSLNPEITTNYTGDVEYQWLDGSSVIGTNINIVLNGTGDYEFRVIFPDLSEDCTNVHEITITESMDAPDFNVLVPDLDCNNSSALVEFVEIDAVNGLQWTGPNGFTSTDNSFSVNEGGLYSLRIEGANGCQNDTTFMVKEDFAQPDIELDVNDLNCINRVTNASFSSDQAVASVEWTLDNGAVTMMDTLVINTPGSYQLAVTGTNGCVTTQPFTITENLATPMVDAGEDQVWQCNTKSLMIEGMVSEGPHELTWSFVEKGDILSSEKQSTIEVGSEGTYILHALNFESGCEMSDSMTIARNEDVPVDLDYVKVDPSCFYTEDGIIQVLDVDGGTEPFRVFINGIQAEDDFMDDLAAGVYSLMVLDDYDCRLIIDVDVEEQPEISLDEMPTRVTIGYNELFTFFAEHNLTADELQSVNWFDANGNLIGEADTLDFQTMENTEITVEVTNQNGCVGLRTIPIEVDFDLPIYAPNVFSPNDDGVNDYFTLFKRSDYPSQILSLSVFNRWGEQVFFKQNFDFDDETAGWDGRKDGQVLPNAVFTYVALVELIDGEEKLVKGTVTLVK